MTPVEFSDEEMTTFREKQAFKTACFWITNCPVLQKNWCDEKEDKILFILAKWNVKSVRSIVKYWHFTYWQNDYAILKFDFAAQLAFLPDVTSFFVGWSRYTKSARRRRVFSPAPVQKQWENIVGEKGNEAYPLSMRVQTTKPHFDLFLPGMNVKENGFFFRTRVQKGIAWHIDASSVVWTLNNGKLW